MQFHSVYLNLHKSVGRNEPHYLLERQTLPNDDASRSTVRERSANSIREQKKRTMQKPQTVPKQLRQMKQHSLTHNEQYSLVAAHAQQWVRRSPLHFLRIISNSKNKMFHLSQHKNLSSHFCPRPLSFFRPTNYHYA